MSSTGDGKPASDTTAPHGDAALIDPTDDPTFQSLKRLLSAPATSTQHLSLLSTNTLYGSITYYLSKLEVEHVGDFVGILTASGCFWTPPPPTRPPQQPDTQSAEKPKIAWSTEAQATTSTRTADAKSGSKDESATTAPEEAPQSLSSFLISRSTAVSHAVANAFDRRVAFLIESSNGSVGRKTRRALKSWLESIIAGMYEAEATSQPESFKASRGLPIPRMAILTGLLQGLYLLRDQSRRRRNMSILEEMAALRANPSLGLRIRPLRSSIEDEWIVTFAEILDALSGDPLSAEAGGSTSETDSEADDWEIEFRKRTSQLAGSAQITALASRSAKLQAVREIQDVPLFLAAQLAPFIPDKKLHALNTEQLAIVTSESLLSLFKAKSGQASFLSHLRDDVATNNSLVTLMHDGETVRRVKAMSETTLFSSLGPLSKLLSKALAREATTKDPESLALLLLERDKVTATTELSAEPILVRMDRLAKDLEQHWLSSPLAGVPEDGIAEASRPDTTKLWTIFKTLLFSYTMAFDSLMDAVLEMCPSPTVTFPAAAAVPGEELDPVDSAAPARQWPPASTSNLPPAYIRIVQSIIETFSHLYWITSTFGSSGFDVYRKVFFSALDVLGRDGEGCVALLARIQPGATPSLHTESNPARRSRSTYFLDVAEQLLPALPDEVIEQLLLPTCRPYLEDTQFKETFESAHSVALAVYTNRRRCMFDLAPFYTDLLMRCFPSRLDSTQLEFAVTTVVGALADRSDSVCWWVVERIAKEIEEEQKEQTRDGQRGTGSGAGKKVADSTTADSRAVPTRAELLEAASSSASAPRENDHDSMDDAKPLPFPRLVTLQQVLIACVPNVNLVLLRSILSKVEAYILYHKRSEEGAGGAGEGGGYRMVLCEKTFDALQALNAATREEGVRWWLDHRAQFGV